jgi:hypothetical protein
VEPNRSDFGWINLLFFLKTGSGVAAEKPGKKDKAMV